MIAIAYFSGAGHTRRLAEAIAAGAGDGTAHAAGRAHLVDVTQMDDAQWQVLDAAETILFGAPTYMGSTAARFDLFLEEASARWPDQLWQDKLAGGFTVATHGSGDKLSALLRLSIYAAQMGMIWVGQTEIGAPVNPENQGVNRDGSWLGLMATSSRDKTELIGPEDLETARRFGQRVAKVTQRWAA